MIRLLAGRNGGAERVFAGTAQMLADAGHRVTILHHEASSAPAAYPLPVAPINLRGRRGLPEHAFRLAARGYPRVKALAPLDWVARHSPFTRGLISAVRELRPDVVISWLPSANTPSLIAGWVTGVPVIPTNHSVPQHDYEDVTRWDPNPIDRALRRYALRAAARIHVLMPGYAAWFPEALRDRVVVIPNYVSAEFTPGAAPRRDVVVSAGRLVASKDHAILIDAWAKLRRPGWSLEIHGEGPERDALTQRLRAHALPVDILRGHAADLASIYQGAAISCHPSRFEGFGLAAAEALASGLPVVGFEDCDGLRELVHDGDNGLMVPRDPDALTEALARLIDDAPLRAAMSARAPASVAAYSLEAYRTRWLALLDQVIH